MKKSLSAAIVFGVTAALVLAGASAATAAAPEVLPTGQKLYAIDCDNYGPQLWSVGADGASTPVGNAYETATGNDCAGGGQTNPVDGITYFVYNPFESPNALATVDLTTGVVTTVADFSGDTTNPWQLFITNDGDAFVVADQVLFSLALATGVTSEIGSMAPAAFGAVGYDALTDTIYSFDYSNDVIVYTINRETGEATDTGLGGVWDTADCADGGTGSGTPLNVIFDSAGFAWIASESCYANTMSVDMTTGESAIRGEFHDPSERIYTRRFNTFYSHTLIIGTAAVAPAADAAPALAATGFNSGAIAVAGGIGAIVILLGAALLFRSRRKA